MLDLSIFYWWVDDRKIKGRVNYLKIKNYHSLNKMFSFFLRKYGYMTKSWKLFSMKKLSIKYFKSRNFGGKITFFIKTLPTKHN